MIAATAAEPELITSPDNALLRRLRRFGSEREPGHAFLEGRRVIVEAVQAGRTVDVLALREGEAFAVPARRTVTVAASLFDRLSQTVTSQGVLAVVAADYVPLPEALERARSAGWPLVVLDGIQDPGNVGGILRTAAAAGVPAVALLPGTADPFGAKAVRASAGNVFRLEVARTSPTDLEGLTLVGASATGGTPYGEADLDVDAIVLGSEAHGLSLPVIGLVSVPMAPGVESLNVAAAAAVLLFELAARKARRSKGGEG